MTLVMFLTIMWRGFANDAKVTYEVYKLNRPGLAFRPHKSQHQTT